MSFQQEQVYGQKQNQLSIKKLLPLANFGCQEHRLTKYGRFRNQPKVRLVGMSPEQYRWLLVDEFVNNFNKYHAKTFTPSDLICVDESIDEFVNNFNEYHAKTFTPSDLICVDESISHWYRQGGEWIYHGLPMYVAMDCKPEKCIAPPEL
jgi:hypothetical protein